MDLFRRKRRRARRRAGDLAGPPTAVPSQREPSVQIDPIAPPSLQLSAETDPELLRSAIKEMVRHGIAPWEVQRVTRAAEHDDPEIRSLALQVLSSQPEAAYQVIRARLRDPVDAVRAEAVRAAAGGMFRTDLVPAVIDRGWPAAQAAALELFPKLSELPFSDEELATLARAIGGMPSSPLARERDALGKITRSVGVERIASALEATTEGRMGLARLLVAEGSPHALRAVASLMHDPDPGLRSLATSALRLLPPGEDLGPPVRTEGRRKPPSVSAETDRHLLALARDLRSLDPAVRDRAMTEVGSVGWDQILAWVRGALLADDDEAASLAATTAERLLLRPAAPVLLQRAAALPHRERGPYVRALSALGSEADWFTGLILEVDPSLRAAALAILWEIRGGELLDRLSSALSSMPVDMRTAVLEFARTTSDPEPTELAFTLLTDDLAPAVRARATMALVSAGPGRRLEALERALNDPAPEVRRLAVEHLTPPDAEADRFVLAALDDPDEEVADAALPHIVDRLTTGSATAWSALRRARGSRRDKLEERLADADRRRLVLLASNRLRSPEIDDRLLATYLLLRHQPESKAETAAEMLADPAAAVRLTAAAGLRGVEREVSEEDLRRAATDPTAEVRAEALRAVAERAEEWSVDQLIDALGDPQEEVQRVAQESLRSLSSRGLARKLVAALDREEVRSAAITLLAGMGRFIEDLLVTAIPSSDQDARRAIGIVLEDAVGKDEYARRLTSLDREQRLGAIDAIGAIDPADSVGLITRALEDPDEAIRIRAVNTLAGSGDPRAVDALRLTAGRDPVAEVADAAREALRRIGAGAPTTARDSRTGS